MNVFITIVVVVVVLTLVVLHGKKNGKGPFKSIADFIGAIVERITRLLGGNNDMR